MILWLLSVIGGNIIGEQLYNEFEKNLVTEEAYQYAEARGKPVLDFGCGLRPRGDYNVDVKPRKAPNFVQVESFGKSLPFQDKFFAAALAFHVLEHTGDPGYAMKELERVSERVYVLTPKPYWIMSYLHPDHKFVFLTEKVYLRNPLYHTKEELNDVPLLFPENSY